MAKYRAVYRDEKGGTFSAPVEKQSDGAWVMHSADGLQLPITLHFNDDAAGTLVFSHYRPEPEPVDTRIHVQAGSTWADQKLAFAEQRLAEERKHREQGRIAFINSQAPDPRKVQAARELNAQILRERRPYGRGVGLIIGNEE